MDTKEFLGAIQPLLEDVDSGGLAGSDGGDPVVPITWSGGELTLAAVLAASGGLKPIERDAYEAKLRDALADAKGLDDFIHAWREELTRLTDLAAEVKLLEVQNFSTSDRSEADDVLYVVALRAKDGGWWIAGPRFEQPESYSHEGGEPAPAPDCLRPLTAHRLLLMWGQQTLVNGQAIGLRKVGEGPLITVTAGTMEGALDAYLAAARFASWSDFDSFGRDDDDPAVQELERFLVENLEGPRMFIMGSWANFSHFVAGKCGDGFAGVMTVAAWT